MPVAVIDMAMASRATVCVSYSTAASLPPRPKRIAAATIATTATAIKIVVLFIFLYGVNWLCDYCNVIGSPL